MKKTTYFIIQFVGSFFLATLIWYFVLMNASYDFYHNSDNSLMGIILFVGLIVYLILTILYIVRCYRKVENRKRWMIIVSVLICAVCAFLGAMGAVYGSELINKLF